MSKKGFLLVRYSAPHLPEGAYETWTTKIREQNKKIWPIMQNMGATRWTQMTETHHNIPRNVIVVEFETEDQALAWHASQEGRENAMAWVNFGTLDLSWNIYGLSSEG